MKAILVDDEAIALEVLENLLSNYDDINIVGSYIDPLEALEAMEYMNVDVIFLDIEMGKHNGLEMAELFINKKNTVEIIFITAYSKYAVEAFEINALDYLLKPIQEKRLSKAIERLQKRIMKSGIEKNEKNTLKILSFGHFRVLDNDNNPLVWRTRKSKELFVYLWIQNEKPISKNIILENIFSDKNMDKAIALLHTTIYQLRKNLSELGNKNGIIYANDSYQLNVPIESDLKKFLAILNLKEHKDEDILEILKIYEGGFLEEEGYHWSIPIQQVYKNMFFELIEKYSKEKLKNKDYSSILKVSLDSMYDLDPYNDNVAELLIEYYGGQSKKTELEIFFNRYMKNLQRELNIQPVENTIQLYSRYMG